MELRPDPDLSFATGYVVSKDLVVVVAEQDKFSQSQPHSFLFFLQGEKWTKMSVAFPIISVCQTTNDEGTLLISLGVDGSVHIAGRRGASVERIQGPETIGTLAQVRNIAGQPYAVGMARQAYARRGQTWVRIDEGVRQAAEDNEVRGFSAVDGPNSTNIYAVGYAGEIWHYDGARWTSLPSPTNLALNSVRSAAMDEVYAAGQCGIVVHGAGNHWEVLGPGQIADDIWGCELFNGYLYVSTSKAVYRFDKGEFKRERIGLNETGASSKLHANDGVLWSFGTKFLARTTGDTWTSVSIPRI